MSSKKFFTPQKFSCPLFVLNSLDSGTCFFCRRKFGGFGVNSLTAREKQPSCLELVEHLLSKQEKERGKKGVKSNANNQANLHVTTKTHWSNWSCFSLKFKGSLTFLKNNCLFAFNFKSDDFRCGLLGFLNSCLDNCSKHPTQLIRFSKDEK